jgi:transposase-like protein
MGVEAGISKSEVSRICAGLDEIVGAFRTRPLGHIEFPYVYLDATYLHVRNTTGQVVSMAVVVATGIAADGSREILGCDVGDSEDETFWRGFLTALKGRGLSGVRLVISDQYAALVKALRRCFQGAGHQRCRVHFARNLLAHVAKDKADMVAAMFRTIFAQPDKAAATAAWEEVRDRLATSFPKVGPLMDDANTEVLAFTAFPKAHWQKIWSTDENVNGVAAAAGVVPGEPSRRSCRKRRPAAAVKVEPPAGRTTLTAARTAVASGGGGRGRPPSEEQHARDWKCCRAAEPDGSRVASLCWRPRPPRSPSASVVCGRVEQVASWRPCAGRSLRRGRRRHVQRPGRL